MTGFWILSHPISGSGDLLHLASFIILLLKIKSRRSCAGISLKTQEIYAVVFLARYMDIFTNRLSMYLTVMKIIFLVATAYIIYLMRYQYKKTYSKAEDSFPRFWLYLVAPCAVLSFAVTANYSPLEILWSFSILLEALAILPQLWMLIKHGDSVETMTAHYIAALGGYRLLYLINWIVRALTEEKYSAWLTWSAGLVQNIIYADFFYHYVISMWQKRKMQLPTTSTRPE